MGKGKTFNPFKEYLTLNIPMPVVQLKGVQWGAKAVYGRLYRYAGEKGVAYPKVATLAEELSMSERQCRQYLGELADAGLISVERTFSGSRFAGSVYSFLRHPCFDGYIGEAKTPQRQFSASGSPLPVENFQRQSSAGGSSPLPPDQRQSSAGLYKEEEKNTEETNNTAGAPEELKNENRTAAGAAENENLDAGAEEEPELAPADIALEITAIYRNTKGLTRPNWNTKNGARLLEKLANLAQDFGTTELIGAVRKYAEEFQPDTPFLKAKPLEWILTPERIRQFAPDTMPSVRKRTATRSPGPPPTRSTPQIAVELPDAKSDHSPAGIIDLWNETMPPPCRCSIMTSNILELVRGVLSLSSADFLAVWKDSMKTCAEVVSNGKLKFTPTLSWFLRDGWAKIANHEFDWALPEKPRSETQLPYDEELARETLDEMVRHLYGIKPDTSGSVVALRRKVEETYCGGGANDASARAAASLIHVWVKENLDDEQKQKWVSKFSRQEYAIYSLPV